jgi:hypothetical protein
MRVVVWGARGAVPTPGPATNRYGGNTSCLEITLSDGTLLVLDAGSGIRTLGLRLATESRRIDILLTHLYLDHIQGLLFFAPLFVPDAEIVVWGPSAAETLPERLARYLSPPHTPLTCRTCPPGFRSPSALRASGRSVPRASRWHPSLIPALPSATCGNLRRSGRNSRRSGEIVAKWTAGRRHRVPPFRACPARRHDRTHPGRARAGTSNRSPALPRPLPRAERARPAGSDRARR